MDNALVTSFPARARRRARSRILVPAAVLAAALGLAACSSGPPPPVDQRPYEAQVEARRAAKDRDFRAPDNKYSPIPDAERASFPGLVYYAIDPRYHVPASLQEDRSNPPVTILLPTSQDQPRRMTRVGTLSFNLMGTVYKLTAFAGEDEGLSRLFVPFGDLTNARDTYRGGRYIELDRTATGLYDLDFNGAYQPFCVFNVNYDCPIPPAENRLPVAIEAGERLRQ
jgi:uncharacterized protein (DUF1684 family)